MAHKHSVYDTDTHLEIDGVTRVVKNASQTKTKLIQHDHNSERFTFEIPRYVDGHDMSICNVVQVHYTNTDSVDKTKQYLGIYEVDDLQISPESDDVVICSWLVSGNATQYVGSLSFVVRFSCVADDGTIDYAWNTAVHTGVSVSTGIYNSDVIAEEYQDVLAQLGKRIEALEKGANTSSGGSARVTYVDLLAANWVGDASPYSQLVTIKGTTERSQVDLTPSVEQLAIFHEKDLAFVTENDYGVITVYAIGQKPTNDYTMQVTITEVIV